MAPNHLEGLNIIHPTPPPSNANDLISGAPNYHDLTSLWTNLNFPEDNHVPETPKDKATKSDEDEEEEPAMAADSAAASRDAIRAGHANIVTGTPAPNFQQQPPLDIQSLLQGLYNPLTNSFPSPPQQQQQQSHQQPSLMQLLAVNNHPPPQQGPQPYPTLPPQQQPVEDIQAPAPKRARTSRKESISSVSSPTVANASPLEENEKVSAAEDKRRRNTAASARFRLKKKEREAALETKAKELEQKVGELERECEGLRRENGWLKGLVVGVTGAASQSQQHQVATAGGSKKRLRGDDA